MPYSLPQLLFFFYFYNVCGWIIESTYVSVLTKKVTNRGFLHGPMIPIYGCGAITLIVSCSFFMKWPVAVFFVGLIAASVLEYITGALMEAIFKVRYWDYSSKKFNINGHVCLLNSLYWGFFAIVLNYFVHKPIIMLSEMLSEFAMDIVVCVVSIFFMADVALSTKAALDIRAMLVKLEDAKHELSILRKRLDVMLAYANESMNEQKDKIGDKFDDITDKIGDKIDDFTDKIGDKFEDVSDDVEEKFKAIKAAISEKPSAFADNVREEYMELREKFASVKSNHFGLDSVNDRFKRNLIKNSPSMISKQYADDLEVIKEYVKNE